MVGVAWRCYSIRKHRVYGAAFYVIKVWVAKYYSIEIYHEGHTFVFVRHCVRHKWK